MLFNNFITVIIVVSFLTSQSAICGKSDRALLSTATHQYQKDDKKKLPVPYGDMQFRKFSMANYEGLLIPEVKQLYSTSWSPKIFELTDEMKTRKSESVEQQAVKSMLYRQEPTIFVQRRYLSISEFYALMGFFCLASYVGLPISEFVIKYISEFIPNHIRL